MQKKAVSAADILGTNGFDNLTLMGSAGSEEGDCGATKKKKRRGNWNRNNKSTKGYTSNVPKKRPLLKAAKMIDKRTKEGKAAMNAQSCFSARELAARAALARFGPSSSSSSAAASARGKQEEMRLISHQVMKRMRKMTIMNPLMRYQIISSCAAAVHVHGVKCLTLNKWRK